MSNNTSASDRIKRWADMQHNYSCSPYHIDGFYAAFNRLIELESQEAERINTACREHDARTDADTFHTCEHSGAKVPVEPISLSDKHLDPLVNVLSVAAPGYSRQSIYDRVFGFAKAIIAEVERRR